MHAIQQIGDVLIGERIIRRGLERTPRYYLESEHWRGVVYPLEGTWLNWKRWRVEIRKPRRWRKTFKVLTRMAAFEYAILFAREKLRPKEPAPKQPEQTEFYDLGTT